MWWRMRGKSSTSIPSYAYVGVGLQSFDNKVLANVERKYDEARFDQTLHELGEVASLAVEVIVGLTGGCAGEFSAKLRASSTAAVCAAGLSLRCAAFGAYGALAAGASA